jgi:hypothetical protein
MRSRERAFYEDDVGDLAYLFPLFFWREDRIVAARQERAWCCSRASVRRNCAAREHRSRRLIFGWGDFAVVDYGVFLGDFEQLWVGVGEDEVGDGEGLLADARVGACGEQVEAELG